MRKVIATTYCGGKQLQCHVFNTYPEALTWVRAATGVKRAVCLKDNTATAAHEPHQSPAWTIEPTS